MSRESRDLRLAIAVVTAIVVAAYGTFIRSVFTARGGDISRFVLAGASVDAAAVPAGLTVNPAIGGYDGVAFYRLALDPFTRRASAFGITLDNPPYRQQRIGYPLLVWLLSLGQARAVPTLLVAVNVLALAGIGIAGVVLARSAGVNGIWGVTFAFYPGFLMSLSRDTSEIVAAALTLGGLAALRSRRTAAAAALLAGAVLTRETTLIVPVALAAGYAIRCFRRDPQPPPAIVFAVPIALYAVWQLVLASLWGAPPLMTGPRGFSPPFHEYLQFFQATLSRRIQLQRLYFAECVFLAIVSALAAGSALRRRGAPMEWRFAWAAQFALAAVLPAVMWIEDFGFLRIFADLYVMSIAVVTPARAWQRAMALCVAGGMWYYLAGHIVALG